jgi:cytochrome b561
MQHAAIPRREQTMPLKSSHDRYGTVAIAIHWITALAVLGLLGSGTVLDNSTDDAARTSILRVHATMGSLVLLLTIARIAWWVFADDHPSPVAGMPAWQERAARLGHLALYALLIVMGASGIGTVILSGALPILARAEPGPLPDFGDLVPRGVHGLAANALILFAVLHVAAALHHQFIRRDRLLARMGVGRP